MQGLVWGASVYVICLPTPPGASLLGTWDFWELHCCLAGVQTRFDHCTMLQAIDASEVAVLRTRLWEEEMATKEAQAAAQQAAAARDALAAEKSQLQTQLSALECVLAPRRRNNGR